MIWVGLGLFLAGMAGLLASFLVTDINTGVGPAWAYYAGLGSIGAIGAGILLIVGSTTYKAVRLVL